MIEPELELLLDELAEVVQTLPPSSASVELGKFVESVHYALATLLEFDRNAGLDVWPRFLAGAGVHVHASFYQQLHPIYGCRNLAGHNNPDAHLVTRERVFRDKEAIAECVISLSERLRAVGRDLAGQVWLEQAVAWRQLRARLLAGAVSSIDDPSGIVLGCVAEAAAPLLAPHVAEGILRAAPGVALRRYISAIGQRASCDDNCALVRLGRTLADRFQHPSLMSWLAQDAQFRSARSSSNRRANIFRVVVFPDPSSEGWLITDAQVLHPSHPDIDRFLSEIRIEAPTREALAGSIVRLFEQVGRVARGHGIPSDARDYVLHVAVPAEVAAESWEALRAGQFRPGLGAQFLCITVEPIDPCRLTTELSEPLDPKSDVVGVWDAAALKGLARTASDGSVLLVGPAAWCVVEGDRPALFWVMDQRAAALVTDHATSVDAVQALLPDGRPQAWVDVLRRVRELRLADHSLKVFWIDRRLCPVYAIPP